MYRVSTWSLKAVPLAALCLLFSNPALSNPLNLSVGLPQGCGDRTDVLGVSRVVEIDPTAGPRYGTSQYKENDFLEEGEVVLTFDDGPAKRYTIPILDALDANCTRATFFPVGRMAVADPETLKEVAKRGHTIASHTWSHKNQGALSAAGGQYEIELGISAISEALGEPTAPFFRFPYLRDTRNGLAYLASRNLAVFSIDVDSQDFRTSNPTRVVNTIMNGLKRKKKGILLFHDLHSSTARAMPALLTRLKEEGYKVVHIVAKAPVETLADYDEKAEKILAGKSAMPNEPHVHADGDTGEAPTPTAVHRTKSKPEDVPHANRFNENPSQIRSMGW